MYFEHRNKSRTQGQVICFLHDCLNITDAHAFNVNMGAGKVYDHQKMPFAVFWYPDDGFPMFKFYGEKKDYWEAIQAEKRPEFVQQCQAELKKAGA